MQVSQIAGLDTHAIIGGGKAQAFGMSDSAEFFTVLSDTLYRDKKRAVIREIVCNAWDAHIAAGKTNIPIEISLTVTELVIKDFGLGIPANKIGPIYCVYGASTKVKDDKQTGGFGLGSKAPFAYSDHFSVTTCHAGVRHVFAISRGGAETEGKPDFREMVRAPTDETGVTVSIPLKHEGDKREFLQHIQAVVTQGGMRANVNGELIEGWDYEPSRKQGFVVVNKTGLHESSVYVLYGTVLYPLSTTDAELTAEVKRLGALTAGDGVLVLIAPPNSIGVTPSRESLSNTDTTRETLFKLCRRAFNMIDGAMRRVAKSVYLKRVEKSLKDWGRPTREEEQRLYFRDVTHDLKQIGMICASFHVGSLIPNKNKVIRLHLAKTMRDQRRLFRRAAYRKPFPSWSNLKPVSRFRYEMRIPMRIAAKAGLLRHVYVAQFGYSLSEAISVVRADRDGFDEGHTVINKLFIAFNQRDAIKGITAWRAKQVGANKLDWNSRQAAVAIILRRGQHGKIAEIRALAKRYKFDLTEMAISKPPKQEPKVVPEFNFHALEKVSEYGRMPDHPTLQAATHYVRAVRLHNESRLPGAYRHHRQEILSMFPQAAVAIDSKDEAKLRAAGAINITDALIEETKAGLNQRDTQFACLVVNGGLLDGGQWHRPSRLIHDLARANPKIAIQFSGLKIKHTPKLDRIFHTLKILQELNSELYAARFADMRKPIAEVLDALRRNAKQTFPACIDAETLNERYRHLEPLARNNFDVSEEDDLKLFLDLAKFLEKRRIRLEAKKKPVMQLVSTDVPAPAPIVVVPPTATTHDIEKEAA